MKKNYLFGLLFQMVLYSMEAPVGKIKSENPIKGHSQQRAIKDHRDELQQSYRTLVNTIFKISEIYFYDARLDDALRLLNGGIFKLFKNELTSRDKLRIQIRQARMMRYKNWLANSSYDSTLKMLFKIEKSNRSLNDRELLADVLDLIGSTLYSKRLFYSRSTLVKPLKYFEQGLNLRKVIDDKRGIAESLFHIGLCYENKSNATDKDKQKAFEYYQDATRIADENNFKLEKSYSTRHIGFIYLHKGELDKALYYFKQSLALREEIGFTIFLSSAYLEVGDIYYKKHQLDKALAYFQNAYTFAEKAKYKRMIFWSLLLIGDVMKEKKEMDTALNHYQKALLIAKSINNKTGIEAATKRIKNFPHERKK